jgi:hypothetical protein
MDIDNVWDRIKKGLKDGATLSMEKIEEYTKIGKLKIDELGCKRKIERNYNDIGERGYELITAGRGKDFEGDLAVKKAVEDIKQLKAELVDIAAKIKAVSDEAKAGRQSTTETDEDIAGV